MGTSVVLASAAPGLVDPPPLPEPPLLVPPPLLPEEAPLLLLSPPPLEEPPLPPPEPKLTGVPPAFGVELVLLQPASPAMRQSLRKS